MQMTAPIHVASVLRRRRNVAVNLRELMERHGSMSRDRENMLERAADPRHDWYWEKVADDLIELIDRGKLG